MSTSQELKAVVRRIFEEAINKGNLDLLDELYTPGFTSHSMPEPDMPPGIEGDKQAIRLLRTAFPDYHISVEDLVAEGDRVVARYRSTGTQNGDFRGIPPTGRRIESDGISIYRLRNGKIVERWDQVDTLGLLQQLGVIPTPGQSG
jgi:predicted ester cyclase